VECVDSFLYPVSRILKLPPNLVLAGAWD
jgi:hypothetical protein